MVMQVPGEVDGFGFEVVAEGEVAEHFEERVVAAGVADVFEIVVFAAGADAFLRGGGAGVIARFEAQEDLLELVHAGVGEEQRGVVCRHEGRTSNGTMAFAGEIIEKFLANLVTCHGILPVSHAWLWGIWSGDVCSAGRAAAVNRVYSGCVSECLGLKTSIGERAEAFESWTRMPDPGD